MKIKYKMLALFVIPFLILTAFSIYAFSAFVSEVGNLRQWEILPSKDEIRFATNIRFLNVLLLESADNMVLFAQNGDLESFESELEDFKELSVRFNLEFGGLQEMEGTHAHVEEEEGHEEELDIKELQEDLQYLATIENALLNDLKDISSIPNLQERMERYRDETKAPREHLTVELDAFAEKRFKEVDRISNRIILLEREGLKRVKSLVIVALAMTAVFILLVVILVRQIAGSIEQITKTVNDISQGRIDIELKQKNRKDEIGLLAQAMERTIVSLKLAMKRKEGP